MPDQQLNTDATVIPTGSAAATTTTTTTATAAAADAPSMIEQIYGKINEVLGGDNSQQYFCLTMPGTVLSPEDYTYDTKDTKPLSVAANESKLLNKLFDPCHITGSDNGRMLTTQYVTALNALSPKLNPNISKLKNVLRDVLNTQYTYHTDEGVSIKSTLQQVFYKLYNEYVLEKEKWSDIQNNKHAELEEKYPDTSDDNKQKKRNEYLQWYETVAESQIAMIEAKFGKVLGVFSINDMKLIESILDSNVGGEIEDAKEIVTNVRKLHPDGGYVYPVTLQPSDWFESLSSDFSYIDLLESPDIYAQKYEILTNKRYNLLKKICDFESNDTSNQMSSALTLYKTAKSNFDTAASNLTSSYQNATVNLIKTLSEFIPVSSEANVASAAAKSILNTVNNTEKKAGGTDNTQLTDIKLQNIFNTTGLQAATNKYTNACQNVSDTALELISANTTDFTGFLKSTYLDLDKVNSDIKDLQEKMKAAFIVSNPDNKYQTNANMFPDAESKRFMQVSISTDASSMNSSTSKKSTASYSTSGSNFFFGGYCQSNSSESTDFSSFISSAETKIDIGFLATKVSCERNWFDPGIFLLTKDMYNTSGIRISKKFNTDSNTDSNATSNTESANFDNLNECIFPCFPTAFVIAKDITIKFSSNTDFSSDNRSAIETHSSKGGGFFCFQGSSSSSSSSNSENTCANTSANSVTLRIPGAQIIGYYMEITPEDRSSNLEDTSNSPIFIADFIDQCKQMLNGMNKDNKNNNVDSSK